MSKKKLKKALRRARNFHPDDMRQAMMQAMTTGNRGGLLAGLSKMLPSRRSEQFLVGAVIGAAAAYVLSDDELRGKLMKSGIKLYASLASGYEEFKEQMADINAEVEAERQGA